MHNKSSMYLVQYGLVSWGKGVVAYPFSQATQNFLLVSATVPSFFYLIGKQSISGFWGHISQEIGYFLLLHSFLFHQPTGSSSIYEDQWR